MIAGIAGAVALQYSSPTRLTRDEGVVAPTAPARSTQANNDQSQNQRVSASHESGSSDENRSGTSQAGKNEIYQMAQLTQAEQQVVQELRTRDREVRQHEQAHRAVGGQYVTSGPTYSYETGPDNHRYAVSGEVGISTSPEETPEKTIEKAQTIRRAALAPAEPSTQDRSVASAATQMEIKARQELNQKKIQETREAGNNESQDQSVYEPTETQSPLKPEQEETEPSTFIPDSAPNPYSTQPTTDATSIIDLVA